MKVLFMAGAGLCVLACSLAELRDGHLSLAVANAGFALGYCGLAFLYGGMND